MSCPSLYKSQITRTDADTPPKPDGAQRIVLFSDIHLGLFPKSILQLWNKRILGSFNHLLRRRHRIKKERIAQLAKMLPALKPDWVVCTGDITSAALPEEFDLAVDAMRPVTDWAGDLFLYVPGNHDAYVNEEESLEALARTFRDLNSRRWKLGELPVTLDVQGLSIMLVNGARPLSPLLSCGVIDEGQQSSMEAQFAKPLPPGVKRIAICHFPAIDENGQDTGWRHGLRGAAFMRTKDRKSVV